MPPTYDYFCSDCEISWIDLVSYEDRDELRMCPDCKTIKGERYYGNVNVSTEKLSATIPAGVKRKGFEDLKKVAKLQVQKADLDYRSEEYKQLGKEIQDRKKLK